MLDRGGAKSYYFSDGWGSIRAMTDPMGTVQNSYSYGAWGELRASNTTVANSYGYTGREFAEEGLYFYRARYLDPNLGRFLSEDPILYNGGMNFYRYVGNNPILFIDPLGLECNNVQEPGKDIRINIWDKIVWEGYWKANALCSLYQGFIIYNSFFELNVGGYPDFCKFTIVTYTMGKFERSINWYNECRDDCGKLTGKKFLFNTGTGKTYEAILDIKRETAYVPEHPPWEAIGK